MVDEVEYDGVIETAAVGKILVMALRVKVEVLNSEHYHESIAA